MGTTLGTAKEGRRGEATLNGHSRKSASKERNNNSDGKVHSAFGKLTLIQDCFPSLNNKESRIFCDKVPSCLFKTKSEGNAKESSLPSRYSLPRRTTPLLVGSSSIGRQEGRAYISLDLSNSTPSVKSKSPQRCFHRQSNAITLSETLKYIGCFTYIKLRRIEGLKPSVVVSWIRTVDKNLIVSGWQDQAFISQPNMIVLYMLLRDILRTTDARTLTGLKLDIMTCLYMCYSYNGHEISYPLKPFLPEGLDTRLPFWNKCMHIVNNYSNSLLLINRDSNYYQKIEDELRLFGKSIERKSS